MRLLVVVDQSENCLKSSQRFIQGFSKLATPLTLMLKTTGSSEVPAPRAIGAGDEEVVGGGDDGGLEPFLSSRMEGEKVEAIKNWPDQKSVRDLQVFLGFANFYRRFIQSFSNIAGPPTSTP